jgi:hypothetical protein
MVNFLFIANHSKIQTIQRSLQNLLKVRIDTVGDFDCGLKEVFEKRPALVFIQEQIDGVTGESVARHIQMLLGAGAPSFVYLHDGNQKAKPVRGLYEYLIDLSQPNKNVISDIQDALKQLLGEQWHKIFIPPKADISAVKAALAVPEEHRTVADKLVDDFISDLGNAGSGTDTVIFPLNDFSLPQVPPEEPFQFVSSPQDQLAELLVETASDHGHADTPPVETVTKAAVVTPVPALPVGTRHHEGERGGGVEGSALSTCESTHPEPAPPVAAPVDRGDSGKAVTQAHKSPATAQEQPPSAPSAPSSSPADFIIKREIPSKVIAGGVLLRPVEKRSPARHRTVTIALALILCLSVVAWYLFMQKPQLLPFSASVTPTVDIPAPAAQKPVEAPKPALVCPLPTFIPVAGHDRVFASQKPGWERYVGPSLEFRVYCDAGRLKAMQILAAPDRGIEDGMLKSLLTELTGSAEYRVTSRESKHGFEVSHATVNRKADLLIYRKGTVVKAVVVSLTESR